MGEGSIDWEASSQLYFDKFFTLQLMERKMHEFINLLRGGMGVKEYRLKFT